VESRFLLDVVVGESATIFELFSSEDESLLIRWDTFLVLDLCLNVINGIAGLDIEGDCLAGEGLDEDLHTTTESEDEVKGGFLLDVVVGESATVFELLTSEDETLLIGWDTFLVLDLSLDVVDGVAGLNVESNGLASESLDEDLHTSSQAENQMESRFLLDVVVGESATVFELLTSEDKTLLIGWDTFLVLDLSLDVVDSVAGFDIESDGLAGESLDEDLHTTSESEDEVKG